MVLLILLFLAIFYLHFLFSGTQELFTGIFYLYTVLNHRKTGIVYRITEFIYNNIGKKKKIFKKPKIS